MSVQIVLFIKVKEQLIETARPVVSKLVHQTRKEPGVQRFDLFQDANNASTFILIQKWASQEALENHRKTQHFVHAIGAVKDWLAAPIDSHILKAVALE